MHQDPAPSRVPLPARSPAVRFAAAPGCGADGRDGAENLLDIRVAAGDAGPVMTLAGEADLTTVGRLEDALNAQITAGARVLTVDLSGLRFADSATIGALARAARALKAQGGRMDLLNPQPGPDRALTLLGVDEVLTVHRGGSGRRPQPPRWR